jgi:site-specific recombinase XerD
LRIKRHFAKLYLLGPLAQLVEHLTFNQGVTGSRPVRPTKSSVPQDTNQNLLDKFLSSRRQGISPRTTEFYECLLKPFVYGYDLTPDDINKFLSGLTCANGKNAYYRAIRAYCNWLYRQGYITENPIIKVDPPKMAKIILPSLTSEQVDELINRTEDVRDKAIISLFADSGIRLSELLGIRENHIDWDNDVVVVWGKGNK